MADIGGGWGVRGAFLSPLVGGRSCGTLPREPAASRSGHEAHLGLARRHVHLGAVAVGHLELVGGQLAAQRERPLVCVLDHAIEDMDHCIAERAVIEPELEAWLGGVRVKKDTDKKDKTDADDKPEKKKDKKKAAKKK